ncbi:MAG: alpha/beta hydrolase-fold protein [Faecalibacterium prausnitzii]
MQEKYFVYLTAELAPAYADPERRQQRTPGSGAVGVDLGAYHAVHCRLRRPKLFAGAMGLSGIYDLARFWGSDSRRPGAALRSPAVSGTRTASADKPALAKAEENSLMLCAGQGAYEGDALADTQALADVLNGSGPARAPRGLGR